MGTSDKRGGGSHCREGKCDPGAVPGEIIGAVRLGQRSQEHEAGSEEYDAGDGVAGAKAESQAKSY